MKEKAGEHCRPWKDLNVRIDGPPERFFQSLRRTPILLDSLLSVLSSRGLLHALEPLESLNLDWTQAPALNQQQCHASTCRKGARTGLSFVAFKSFMSPRHWQWAVGWISAALALSCWMFSNQHLLGAIIELFHCFICQPLEARSVPSLLAASA